MNEELHEQLLKETNELKNILANCSTETIVGSVMVKFLPNRIEVKDEDFLSSRVKQLFYLLSLMLTTPEPTNPKQFGDEEWKRSRELLELIFNRYALMFYPSEDEKQKLPENWFETRSVAKFFFLHYFNVAVLASIEQVIERIENYLFPFNNEIEEVIKIKVSDCLEITKWISKHIQEQMNDLIDLFQKVDEIRLTLLDKAEKENWTLEKLREEANTKEHLAVHEKFFFKL